MPERTRTVVVNTTPMIIDERLARRHAKRLGLTLTGTLGVLLKAKERGLVPTVEPLIDELRQGGIRLDDALVDLSSGVWYTVLKMLPGGQRWNSWN